MEQGSPTSANPFPRIRVESVVVAVAAVVFVVLLFVGAGSPEYPQQAGIPGAAQAQGQRAGTQSTALSSKPTEVSAAELRAQAGTLARPVYWVGQRPATKLELTVASPDRVFLRYLPADQRIGAAGLRYPFVATYGLPDAFAKVRSAARKRGAVVRTLPGGGLAVQNRRSELVKAVPGRLPAAPVFFAYPGSDRLVEVFDRSPARALALVTSGRARPVR